MKTPVAARLRASQAGLPIFKINNQQSSTCPGTAQRRRIIKLVPAVYPGRASGSAGRTQAKTDRQSLPPTLNTQPSTLNLFKRQATIHRHRRSQSAATRLSNRPPTTAHRQPPTDNRQPTTDNRQPTTHQSHRFVFYGGGKRRGEIEAFMAAHPEAPVELHDYAPAEELAAHLKSADVHLVSLNAEWTGTMVPSKLQGIFAAARPVIFIGSEASSIGGWVRESGGGWVVRPGDVAGLRAALDEARHPSVRALRGKAALAYANAHFDKCKNVSEVAALFIHLKSDI